MDPLTYAGPCRFCAVDGGPSDPRPCTLCGTQREQSPWGPDGTLRPEVVTAVRDERPSSPPAAQRYWLDAWCCRSRPGVPSRQTGTGGKWLIFVPRETVDEWWEAVRRLLEAGELGRAAKVSTMRPNPNAKDDPNKHVIVVYTDDHEAVDDVRRVRERLGAIGVTWRIPYKTDEATRAGQYQVKGHHRISKYYE